MSRAAAAVAFLLVALAGLTATGSPGATALPVPQDGGLPVEIEVTSVSPQVLAPGEDLQITVTLTNHGSAAVEEPRVAVLIDRTPFISRSSLDRWREREPEDPAGFEVATVELAEPLAAGASAVVSATVEAAAVGLPRTARSWGPRGLAVSVSDRADPGRPLLGLARTFLLWFPEQEVTATRMSILAPVIGPPPDPFGTAWFDELEDLTAPQGRLGALLAATAEHRDVTWVVDPWLVEATSAVSTGPTVAEAGDSARRWSADLLAAMTDRDVQLLPYADADVAALAHAGVPSVLETAFDRGRAIASRTAQLDSARTSLAWPVDPLPDLATASIGTAGGDRALVVGPGELPPPDVLTYTPTSRTSTTTLGGEVSVLVPDERLSEALRTGHVPTMNGASLPPGPTPTPATAAQDLLAEMAVITRERPSDGRHMLLTVPREWHPDPEVVRAQLDALEDAPWARMEPIAALIGTDLPEVDRGTLPVADVEPGEVSAATLAAVAEAVEDRALIAEIVEDPDQLLGDVEREVLAVTSAAWRDDPAGRAELVELSAARTAALRDSVGVQEGSAVNLTSATAELPVRVTNELDQEVTIDVALVPGDSRLVVDETVAVTIPPQGEELVRIPVHAVQSADVVVRVELRTPSGAVLDDSTAFTVRVRAEWEGIGTAVLGVLLALGLVIGLIRTIRRGRGGRRAAPVSSGPDALSPEWAESEQVEPGHGAEAEARR